MTKRSIKTEIKKNRQKYLDELFDLLKVPSITKDKKATKHAARLLTKKFKSLGFDTKVIKIGKSNPYILAKTGNGSKKIVIYNHYDVQPIEPLNLWRSDPFDPVIRGGKIYARGVADNKANLMLRIQAIEVIKRVSKNNIPLEIVFLVEGEEETGSPNIGHFCRKYGRHWQDSNFCLWESGRQTEDGNPVVELGKKGIAYFLLSCTNGAKDIHSRNASLVDSAVWRLVHALSTLRDVNGNVTIDGLNRLIKPPTKKEIELIRKEKIDIQAELSSIGRKRPLVDTNSKNKILTRHYFSNTCNICGIWSGTTNKEDVKTIIPNQAYAKIDLRLVSDVDSKKIKGMIQKHLKKRGYSDIEVEEMAEIPVGKSNIENKDLRRAISIISKSSKKEVVVRPTAKGSGPYYYTASQYNIPVVELGADYPGSSVHGPNENIRVRDYFKALERTATLFSDY